MIEFTKAYVVDNTVFKSLSDAQEHAIQLLFETGAHELDEIAKVIVSNKDHVIDILTTKENSLPKARAINGGRKPRKKAPVAEDKPTLPSAA